MRNDEGRISASLTIVKRGPKKGHRRLSTRLAHVLARIGKCAPGKMVRIDLDGLARTLGCSSETLRKLTMRLRTSAWFFQGFHTVVFLTHETADDCPRGAWTLWVCNRHSLHRVWAAPGARRRLRWHLRKGAENDWIAYGRRIKNLAMAMLYRGKKRRDGKHKGFSPGGCRARAGGARAPNHRAAFRRYGKIAARLDLAYSNQQGALNINLHGWAVNRLREGHHTDDILSALAHATKLVRKRRQIHLDNPVAWLSHVATRLLNSDGLVPGQRHWQRNRKAGR